VTGYFFIQVYGDQGVRGSIPRVPTVNLNAIDSIPLIGPVFGHLNLMIWLTFLTFDRLVRRHVPDRPIGLRIRSVGEHPRSCGHRGHLRVQDPLRSRDPLGHAGGSRRAYLSIGFVGSFNENMTAGRGFIGLAALIFGTGGLSAPLPLHSFLASRRRCHSVSLSRAATQPFSSSRSRTS